MPQPELDPRNTWDAHERLTQAIDLIAPLAETELGIRGMVRAAVGEMRAMQTKVDLAALMEANGHVAPTSAVAASGGTSHAAP